MRRPLLFLAAALALPAQEHAPDQAKNPFRGNAPAARAGEKLFAQSCQGCHGGGGRGDRAPAVNTGRFTRGGSDGELFLNIRSGIGGTQMPGFGALTTEQVWQLVTYLREIGGGDASGGESVPGNPGDGQRLFFGKARCAACHEVNGRGGVAGPDLSAAGRLTAERLRTKILRPSEPAPGAPPRRGVVGGVVSVRTVDGLKLRGIRTFDDTFTVHVMTPDGKRHLLSKARVVELTAEEGSLMPSDYEKRLTANEVDDLVAYMKTRTVRGEVRSASPALDAGLTYARLRNASAEPENWLHYWGTYDGAHFSPLDQVRKSNAATLQLRWAAQLPGDSLLQATPVVVDGVLYTTGSPGTVAAIDARSGAVIWKYQRAQKKVNPYESNRFNRGVAVLGNRVFFGTLDAALVALDARTGLPLWETQVADTMEGYSLTLAPLAVKDKIIVGVAGGEYGIRGFLDAYDAVSGRRAWRFHTVPGPGEFGHDSWKGDSWKRGGAPTWLTGTFDPELNTLYWATGNPGPDMNSEIRRGDNLFSCSVVALDPDTGKRKWHYQFTPGDDHDWDSNEGLILADREIDGKPRKLLLHGDRNGLYYVLDRTDGRFVAAKAFVRQTWNAGFTPDGRPIWHPNQKASPEGTVVFPSLGGATNWQSPSYDAARGVYFLATNEAGQRYFREDQAHEPGKGYWGGRTVGLGIPAVAAIKALDAATGTEKWRFPISRGSLAAGVLGTAGGVLFAATQEGSLLALDSDSGKLLWRAQTGGTIASSPMSYAVDGVQYVAISAGNVLYSFALPGEL